MRIDFTNGLELQLLESLIFFLLVIPIVRVFIYRRRSLDGLALIPPFALIINLAIFPAYGFHLESIPLLICNIILNILNFRVVFHRSTVFYIPSVIHIVLGIFLLSTTVFAVYFSPVKGESSIRFRTRTFSVDEEQWEFTVRLYPETVTNPSDFKGVLVVAPPFEGVSVIDRVCATLAAEPALQDFLIVVLDQPSPTLWERLRFIPARLWGTSYEQSNNMGRKFEHEKKRNLQFLLSRIQILVHGADVPVFLLGYDASGSAVYSLTTDDETVTAYNIKGAIGIEVRLWSMYYRETSSVQPPDGFFKRLAFNALGWLSALKPKKTTHIAQPSQPSVPFLFLTSDRIASRNKQYAAVLKLFPPSDRNTSNAILLAREGAGSFDYMDYPETQPLFSALNPSAAYLIKGRERRAKDIPATAAVIAGFIESILEGQDFHHQGYYQE
jgi:hypothetical protein